MGPKSMGTTTRLGRSTNYGRPASGPKGAANTRTTTGDWPTTASTAAPATEPTTTNAAATSQSTTANSAATTGPA
jgi:hypothetical protein